MSQVKALKAIFSLFLLTLSANVSGQLQTEILVSTTEILPQNFTQIFTDSRDSNKYHLVASSDRYWLNANLRFKTIDSDCLDDQESNCSSLGRLYSWEEAQNVCPENWKLPTIDDFRELYKYIASEEEGKETGIFFFPYTWDNFNNKNPARITINKNGLKDKRRYISDDGFNLWLRPTDKSNTSHIHGHEIKKEKNKSFTIFPKNHSKKNPTQLKLKMGVRCVIPTSEFNKLMIGHG